MNLIDNRINARNAEAIVDEGEDDGALETAEEFAQAIQNPGSGRAPGAGQGSASKTQPRTPTAAKAAGKGKPQPDPAQEKGK